MAAEFLGDSADRSGGDRPSDPRLDGEQPGRGLRLDPLGITAPRRLVEDGASPIDVTEDEMVAARSGSNDLTA